MKNIAAKVFKIDKNSCVLATANWSGRSNFPRKIPPPLKFVMAQCCWIEVENFKCTPEVRHLLVFIVFKGKTNGTVRLKYVQFSRLKWHILLQICVFVSNIKIHKNSQYVYESQHGIDLANTIVSK